MHILLPIDYHISAVGQRVAGRVFPQPGESNPDGVEAELEHGAKHEQLQLHVKFEDEFEVERNVHPGGL